MVESNDFVLVDVDVSQLLQHLPIENFLANCLIVICLEKHSHQSFDILDLVVAECFIARFDITLTPSHH